MYNPLVDYNLGDELNPAEWAEIFKYVDFCITDRFHGAIFCIKNNTPFIAIETKSTEKDRSKKYQLLKDFNILKFSYLDIFDKKYNSNEFNSKYDLILNNKKQFLDCLKKGQMLIKKQNDLFFKNMDKVISND